MKGKGHIPLFRTINYNSCTLPLLQCSDNNIFLSLSIVIDAPAGREECQDKAWNIMYYLENYQVCSLPRLVLQLHRVPVLDVAVMSPTDLRSSATLTQMMFVFALLLACMEHYVLTTNLV